MFNYCISEDIKSYNTGGYFNSESRQIIHVNYKAAKYWNTSIKMP